MARVVDGKIGENCIMEVFQEKISRGLVQTSIYFRGIK